MGSKEIIKIDENFILIRFQNESDTTFRVEHPIEQGLIQFHFNNKL